MCAGPDQRAFEADVAKAAFRLGQADGRWQLLSVKWPFAYLSITAKDGTEFPFRLECTDYPRSEPTGGPWDMQQDIVLPADQWPQGNGGRVSAVFRLDWEGGRALYLPCDRVSIRGHLNWLTELPAMIWRPADGIVQYLEQVHELLNSKDFLARIPTAA